MWSAIARGVSTRGYRDVIDPLPAPEIGRAISRSAVSRRFVTLSTEHLREFTTRPPGDLDTRTVLIDGIVFRNRDILIPPGIAADVRKHPLALCEDATENATVPKALLEDLTERGLSTERTALFEIDGSKALRPAIRDIFGRLAPSSAVRSTGSATSSSTCRNTSDRASVASCKPRGDDRRRPRPTSPAGAR